MTNHKNNNNNVSSRGEDLLTIHLIRKVTLKHYPIMANVTFLRLRPDLVSLLEKAQDNAQSMPARLTAYLQKENLWDQDVKELTEKGETVLSSGTYEAKERGLYHIWYTDIDPLLGTIPIFMQRDTALFEPKNMKVWKKGPDAAHSKCKVDVALSVQVLDEGMRKGEHSKTTTLSLSKLEPEVICSPMRESMLELHWNIDGSASNIDLKGNLDVLDFRNDKGSEKPEAMNISIAGDKSNLCEIMKGIALEFNGRWDDLAQRLAAPFEKIKTDSNAVANFTVAHRIFRSFQTDFGQFDSVTVKHIALKPTSLADAKKWHQHWLEDFYSYEYRPSKGSREQQAAWLDHPALTEFALPLKEGTNVLNALTREKHPQAYWHVAAMADLTPSKSKKLKYPLSLVNGDALNIQNLIKLLTEGEHVKQIIYADRYVHTAKQSRNLEAVAACVRHAKGRLFTLDSQNRNEARLPAHWTRKILQKQPDNHGRYWIFISHSHTICWECTSGLDFIGELIIGEHIIDGTPTFTPKEKHELPRFLQDAIKEMTSLESLV